MSTNFLKAGSALVAVFIALHAGAGHTAQEQKAQAKPVLPAIVVTRAVSKPMVERVTASGSVKAVEEVYVQPQVDGLSIETLAADVGDRVTAGSVLATLSKDSLVLERSRLVATKAKAAATLEQSKAQLLEARANADDANRQRDRASTLNRQGSGALAQAEQTASAAAVAQARVKSAEQAVAVAQAELQVMDSQIADTDLKLARTGVTTPVSGIVAARKARIGSIASGNSDPLFTIIRDGDLELVADVTETDLLKIRTGQKTRIMLAGSPEALGGSVRLVSPSVDASTRLGSVHVAIDDDAKARAGMYGAAQIVITESTGIALSLSAITVNPDGATARKVENGVVKQVAITTGIQDGSFIQIVSGLQEGDTVVAKAGAFVRDGDHIKPVDETPAVSN